MKTKHTEHAIDIGDAIHKRARDSRAKSNSRFNDQVPINRKQCGGKKNRKRTKKYSKICSNSGTKRRTKITFELCFRHFYSLAIRILVLERNGKGKYSDWNVTFKSWAEWKQRSVEHFGPQINRYQEVRWWRFTCAQYVSPRSCNRVHNADGGAEFANG